MLNPEREDNSTYEGPPLPFFLLIPWGRSFWACRILVEPCAVFLVAWLLGNLYILQSSAVLYLQVAALMLAMKQYISWFQAWSYVRNLLDLKNVGPQISRLVDNTATDDELAKVHLASFPKNLPPDIRKATVAHIARTFSYEPQSTTTGVVTEPFNEHGSATIAEVRS